MTKRNTCDKMGTEIKRKEKKKHSSCIVTSLSDCKACVRYSGTKI